MERILYNGIGYCAVTENGTLTEYIERDRNEQCGDILGGTVERIIPGINGAFVKIGRKKAGFLPLQESSLTFSGTELKSGMKIPVQIRKEETGNKGAFLTRDLVIAGHMLLLMPMNRYIGVSRRITDADERECLRKTGMKISGGRTGIVMREAAAGADPDQISAEADELAGIWNTVSERIQQGFENGTVLLHQDPVNQMISDYMGRGIDRIIETETLPSDLQRQLREAGNRTVRIRNGGNIVIDRCEAMTVIDVNSGSASSGRERFSAYLETNLAACETIAAQIRLRNLAGIILIDFIDMLSDADRARVEEKMRKALTEDRRKTVIHGWTKLGILEMTRKRTGTAWEGMQSP